METSPAKTSETGTEAADDGESSTTRKKKKKAGAFVVSVESKEAKPLEDKNPEAERPPSLIERVLKGKDKEAAGNDAGDEAEPAAGEAEHVPAAETAGIEAAAETGEVPLEELSPEEARYVERTLTEAAAQAEAAPEEAGDGAAQAEAAAIARFRKRILQEHKDADTAEQETLEELELPPEVPETLAAEEKVAGNNPEDKGEDAAGTPPGTIPAAGASSGGSARPPAGGPPFAGAPGFGNAGYNAPPAAPAAVPRAAAERPTERVEAGANPATMALFGGIVGYFIGRRRGRIKTEKRLLPIQKKLEQQVEGMSWQLRQKETTIRKAARERVQAERVTATALRPVAEGVITARTAGKESVGAKYEAVVPLREQRTIAPEANQLHGKKPAPEQIGHVLVDAELQPLVRRSESLSSNSSKREALPDGKHVETMTRPDLLALSERIVVDGTSLRQVYETRLVSEKGLRRLVAEYLRGGDIKQALRQEVVEREIDFERDPVMRDQQPAAVSSAAGGPATTLQGLLRKADAALPSDNSGSTLVLPTDKQKASKQPVRSTDVALIGTIIVLALLVIILFLTRG